MNILHSWLREFHISYFHIHICFHFSTSWNRNSTQKCAEIETLTSLKRWFKTETLKNVSFIRTHFWVWISETWNVYLVAMFDILFVDNRQPFLITFFFFVRIIRDHIWSRVIRDHILSIIIRDHIWSHWIIFDEWENIWSIGGFLPETGSN